METGDVFRRSVLFCIGLAVGAIGYCVVSRAIVRPGPKANLFHRPVFLADALNCTHDAQQKWIFFDTDRNVLLLITTRDDRGDAYACSVMEDGGVSIWLGDNRHWDIHPVDDVVLIAERSEVVEHYVVPPGFCGMVTKALGLDQLPTSRPADSVRSMMSVCQEQSGQLATLQTALMTLNQDTRSPRESAPSSKADATTRTQ